jgi:outer membrane receptor for ferrienterochelin and colicin
MTRQLLWRNLILGGASVTALLAASGAAAQAGDPGAPAAQTADSPGPQTDASAEGEAIVVRGVRGSLLRSIQAKRDADTIVDAISAEELGKFPNRNVAEALANIPGVTVGRDGRGEGRDITIRGLGENFAITTLNGRILPTDGADRSFAFDVLPSEII